ncbi:MAG TPA: MFS transporter [Pseudomonadales bacterium]|nr:MFS transporter [Pseudomonadales bacterium]
MSDDTDRADLRAERRFQIQVQRNLTRNYLAHLVHGMLSQTGFRLLNAPTFMPAYIMMLSGGSNFAVGLSSALQSFGMTLTPMIGANLIEHRKQVLPVALSTGWGMRGMILAISLTGLVFPTSWALWPLLLFLAVFGLFQGMQGVIFNFLMAKLIPSSKRGRLTGLRNFLAGIISALIAWVSGQFLIGSTPTAAGYSYTFLLAFVLTSIGLSSLVAVREPEPPVVRPKQDLRTRLAQVPSLLRDDREFTRYFLARALATLGRMAMPFYILHEGHSSALSGSTLGILTFAFTLAGTFSNLLWGPLGDRYGFRASFLSSIGLWVASTLLLMLVSGSLWVTVIVFVGIGASAQGFQNASQNMTLEFGRRDDLPVRIAIANTASELAGTFGPLLGGALAALAGYQAVFLVSIVFLVLGGGIVARYVPEPRKQGDYL